MQGEHSGSQSREDIFTAMTELRDKIDAVDEKLLVLLNQRAGFATDIGHIKRGEGMEIYVPSREKQVLEHVQASNPGPLRNDAIRRLFERIIDESRRLEQERAAELRSANNDMSE
jgi:chorismate mutase